MSPKPTIATLSEGAHTIVARVSDSAGAIVEQSITVVVQAVTGAGGTIELFVDNLDTAKVSKTGTWKTSSRPKPWLGNSQFSKGAATFRWQLDVAETGEYEAFIWWTDANSRSDNAPITIVHAEGTDTVYKNQREDGGIWHSLGRYQFTSGGEYSIEISGSNGPASADAVKLQKGSAPVVVDDSDSNTRGGASWASSTRNSPWKGRAKVNSDTNSGAGRQFRWLPELPEAGRYRVYAWWPHYSTRATNAPYRIKHSAGIATHEVDQSDPALGSRWVLLGDYEFAADGTEYVELSSENGAIAADAVKFVKQ